MWVVNNNRSTVKLSQLYCFFILLALLQLEYIHLTRKRQSTSVKKRLLLFWSSVIPKAKHRVHFVYIEWYRYVGWLLKVGEHN